jgi:hypothetical protein
MYVMLTSNETLDMLAESLVVPGVHGLPSYYKQLV